MRPLILDFKVSRIENSETFNYVYDIASSMNFVEVNGSRVPFIDLKDESLQLVTKTRVKAESEDNDSLIQTATKTKIIGEQDDNHYFHFELATKTLVKTERDDTSPTHN